MEDLARRITPLTAVYKADHLLHLTGEGRTPILVVERRDVPLATILSRVNETLGHDAYRRADRVAVGMLDLRRNSGFHETRGGGASYGIGSAGGERGPGMVVDAPEEIAELDNAVWIVTDTAGNRRLAVLPNHLDSFEVVAYVEPTMTGRFTVELVDNGTFFALPHLVTPGWTLMTDRSRSLDLTPEADLAVDVGTYGPGPVASHAP